ncbi:hypothetical protein LA6_006173 (plasmid) [Marinibacterium anthonyi]|nr:hypothetical protein LA6_006173 [Marinibacterium anthonyi]
MKPALNIITPLPPKKSGIANYALKVSSALTSNYDVTFVIDQDDYDIGDADLEVIQLSDFVQDAARTQNLSLLHMGNNPDHRHVYRASEYVSGLIVQHDLVLHHFVEAVTLAEGKFDEYSRILELEYGEAGRSLAAGRQAGLFDDSAKFLFPAVAHFVRRGRGAIVHSEWAANRLRPIMAQNLFHIPHFVEDDILARSANEMRSSPVGQEIYKRLGIPEDRFVVGSLGFATDPKCIRELMIAISRVRGQMPNLHLVIGGEMHISNLGPDLQSLIDDGLVTVTGYLNRTDLEYLCARLDLLFNMRFPIAGESSGILSMAMGFGTPCAVFEFGPMAEVEANEAIKMPFFGTGEVLVESLEKVLHRVRGLPPEKLLEIGRNGKRRVMMRNSISVVAEGYSAAIKTILSN